MYFKTLVDHMHGDQRHDFATKNHEFVMIIYKHDIGVEMTVRTAEIACIELSEHTSCIK
jgi:hypothetical protein